uniref:Uncharacterized protein n=1 Tax=Corethron hystrix TaxID=216773 RepID=A0A7S1C066_9STRA
MYKQVRYASLFSMVEEFLERYKAVGHVVARVMVGLPVSHDDFGEQQVKWKFLKLDLKTMSLDTMESCLNRYARECEKLMEYYLYAGKVPPKCDKEYMTGKMDAARRSVRKRHIWNKETINSKYKSK